MAWAGRTATPLYRKNRRIALSRDENRCQLKLPGCTVHADDMDHIINVAEGGTDELSNLQSVCHPCHIIKTRGERARAIGRNKRAAMHPDTFLKHPGLL